MNWLFNWRGDLDLPRVLAAVAVLLVLGLLCGLLLGGWAGARLGLENGEENRNLREQLASLQAAADEMRQLHTNSETRAMVDAAALELVRKELVQLQQEIADLDQGIRFYRSLMTPAELEQGLGIRGVDVIASSDGIRLQFRVIVQQRARKHENLEGSLRVELHGTLNEEEQMLELSQLSRQVPSADIRLRFKYFQAIDGELVLPEGFRPDRWRLVATARTPRRTEVIEEFPWQIQERPSHVGQ